MRLRVLHSLPPLQFAPFFVATGRGIFRDAGVEIETIYDGQRAHSVELVQRGEIDCFLSGPLRTFDLAAKDVKPIMASISVLNHRVPFYLIGSGQAEPIAVEALRGRRIVLRRAAPPITLLMRRLVRMAGIDPSLVEWVLVPDGVTELEALGHGLGDYAILAEPEVEEVVSTGSGHIAINLPQVFGPMHFAAVVAPVGFIDRSPELARLLVKSVQNAKDWMTGAPAEEVADAIGVFMPETPKARIAGSVRRGQRDGMWSGGAAFSRWQFEILKDTYLGEDPHLRPVPFSDAVDNRAADALATD